MKNIMIISLAVFLIGCKESAERSIVINAPINEVWSVVSDLGEHAEFITSIDSTTLFPKGEATIGAEWAVHGKYEYYAKNEIIAVERMKRIKTKLIEHSWPMKGWNETITLNKDSENTMVLWKIDFDVKGVENLILPIGKGAIGDYVNSKLEDLKVKMEK